MADSNTAEQISLLEAEIERLAEIAERCRKIIVAARIAIAAGALWALATALGMIVFNQIAVICSITAVIGGIVAYGSNKTTLQQTLAAMKAADARRSGLIDMIDLKPVTDE